MANVATNRTVDRSELEAFVRPRHRGVLMTRRSNAMPQLSPVTCGLDPEGRVVVSSYPERAKVRNLERNPAASIVVLSDDFGDEWVQLDGRAEVLTMPDPAAEEGLVEYYRCIRGEHPDWDDYRRAMRRQGKSLLRVTVDDWGPLATGGFPPHVAEDLAGG